MSLMVMPLACMDRFFQCHGIGVKTKALEYPLCKIHIFSACFVGFSLAQLDLDLPTTLCCQYDEVKQNLKYGKVTSIYNHILIIHCIKIEVLI